MVVKHWISHRNVRSLRRSSTTILKHRLTRRPAVRRAPCSSFKPAASPRSFTKRLAHTKTQRLRTIIARRRRTVCRRMVLDHDFLDTSVAGDMEIYQEQEVDEMVVELRGEDGGLSAAAYNTPEGTSQVSMVLSVAEEAPIEMAPQTIGEVAVDDQMEGEGSGMASALVKVLHDTDVDSLMLSENALSVIAKVLRDADDDGPGFSESPSAALIPKMAVEDDVVLLMEKRTAAVRLHDDGLFPNEVYSQSKLQRSCRSGYYRYEPYLAPRLLRLRRRRSKVVRTKTPESGDGDGTDCIGDKTLVEEECSTTSEDKIGPNVEFSIEEMVVAPSEARGAVTDAEKSCHIRCAPSSSALDLSLQEKEEKCITMEGFSDIYRERPPDPYGAYWSSVRSQEKGIERLGYYPVTAKVEECVSIKKPDPYFHVLPREVEDQDDWLNEASDLYWERPFTPAVASSPSLIQLEVGIEKLEISPAVTTSKESTKPEKSAARQIFISLPTHSESSSPAPAASPAHLSPQCVASMPDLSRLSSPIQVPPKVLHREAYHDKENWTTIHLDLETGPGVAPPPKHAQSLVRSVFGTLRTWVGIGRGSR